MILQGQNIRFILDGLCVAAATSEVFHVGINVESASSKDDTGMFDKNEVIGKNWDGSIDAGYVPVRDKTISGTAICDKTVGNYSLETDSHGVEVRRTFFPGQTIDINCTHEYQIFLLDANNQIIAQSGVSQPLTHTFDKTQSGVIIALFSVYPQGEPCPYTINNNLEALDADHVIELLKSGALLQVKFSTTVGDKNRGEETLLAVGYAYLTDVSVTSSNKQKVTFSAKLTGSGELSFD